MESVEITAKTVEEAIEIALKELNARREDVEIQVLSRGRSGLLGIGAEPARVRVSMETPTPPPVVSAPGSPFSGLAQATLEQLLQHMGIDARVSVRDGGEETEGMSARTASLEVNGPDAGLLIGRRGETLASLQYLLNFVLSRQEKGRAAVSVDVEGYKERRATSLRRLALTMAEQVSSSGRFQTLEPMPPRERRIIHLVLANHPKVVTQSTGEGENRKVVILPRKDVS